MTLGKKITTSGEVFNTYLQLSSLIGQRAIAMQVQLLRMLSILCKVVSRQVLGLTMGWARPSRIKEAFFVLEHNVLTSRQVATA